MINSYQAAEIVETIIAKDLIRGEVKGMLVDDGPDQAQRTIIREEID